VVTSVAGKGWWWRAVAENHDSQPVGATRLFYFFILLQKSLLGAKEYTWQMFAVTPRCGSRQRTPMPTACLP
jgi:hypothetical protein